MLRGPAPSRSDRLPDRPRSACRPSTTSVRDPRWNRTGLILRTRESEPEICSELRGPELRTVSTANSDKAVAVIAPADQLPVVNTASVLVANSDRGPTGCRRHGAVGRSVLRRISAGVGDDRWLARVTRRAPTRGTTEHEHHEQPATTPHASTIPNLEVARQGNAGMRIALQVGN